MSGAAPSAPWHARIRIRQWAHFLALPLAGYDTAAASGAATAFALARGVAIAFGVLAFAFLVNAIADRAMDRDARKNPLAQSLTAAGSARLAVAFGATALAIAFTASTAVLVATGVALAAGAAYSVGPRLKGVPILGTAMNPMIFAPLLWVGVGATIPSDLPTLTILFASLLVQNQLLHEAADADEDRGGAVHTTFLLLGPRGTGTAAAITGIAVTAAIVSVHGFLAAAPAACVYILVFPALMWNGGHSTPFMATVRRVHRWSAAFTGTAAFLAATFLLGM
jgi:4-hydroxybenzoate polyprenyltransferase